MKNSISQKQIISEFESFGTVTVVSYEEVKRVMTYGCGCSMNTAINEIIQQLAAGRQVLVLDDDAGSRDFCMIPDYEEAYNAAKDAGVIKKLDYSFGSSRT